jgi:hypothetical protein
MFKNSKGKLNIVKKFLRNSKIIASFKNGISQARG